MLVKLEYIVFNSRKTNHNNNNNNVDEQSSSLFIHYKKHKNVRGGINSIENWLIKRGT